MKTLRTEVSIICLGIFMCLAVSSPVHAKNKDRVPEELMVKFKPATTRAEIKAINKENNCKVIKKFKLINVYHLKIKSGLTVEEVVDAYNSNPAVEYAHANYLGKHAQRTTNNAEEWPNDASFDDTKASYGKQWSLDNWGQTAGGKVDADIDAPQMWKMITDSDIIVAVLDSGIDLDHEDLAANIWKNQAELNGLGGVDDDGNGYVDDVTGWDFSNDDNDPDDPYGHGSHVAGIIGAVGDNGKGIAGVCWSVQLMPVQILDATGSGGTADLISGIEYAAQNGAKIINLSLQDYFWTQSLEDIVDVADANGILIVAAAGNHRRNIDQPGNECYPGSLTHDNVITVAASNNEDARWDWGPGNGSNWGPISVDIAAPGEDIYSTVNYIADPCNGYDTKTGTSMAAPHVSGAAALVWALDPTLDHLGVKAKLLDAADSFNAAKKEKKPDFKLGSNGQVVTEGRLRAAANADFGDSKDMPYPTNWPPSDRGAIHLDCGLEWLGDDVSVERSASDVDGTDTDGVANLSGPEMEDEDGFDDGVELFPPYFCNDDAGDHDQVDVTVTVSDPTSGRYGGAYPDGKFLYLNSFFDFNEDGDWDDVFTCQGAGDAPEHLLIQSVAGPGAASVVNPLPDNKLVIDPSLWGGAAEKTSKRIELYFYSPPKEDVDEDYKIHTRFRLEYDDKADFPAAPNHKYLGTYSDYSLFGEVEDHVVECVIDPCAPDYEDWIEAGRPYCWCFDTQCEGDADGKTEGGGVLGSWHVGTADIGVLAGAWLVKEPTKGPGITSVDIGGIPGACADFDHDTEGAAILGIWRVGTGDIGILASNWMVKEPTKGSGIAKACQPGTFIAQ